MSTMHSLRFFEQGFRTAALTAGPTHDMWLWVVSETLAYIHNSIQTTHSTSTLPVAFDNLSQEECPSFDLMVKTLHLLETFFDNYFTDPLATNICLRCLYEGPDPVSEPTYKSVMLSCDQNVSAAYATITNTLIRELHTDLTTWAEDTQGLVRDAMIQALTNDQFDISLIDANDDIKTWLCSAQDSVRDTLKGRAEAQAREEAESFFRQRSKALTAEAEEAFNKFKHELKIKTELRKDNAIKAADAAVKGAACNHPRAPPLSTASSGRVTRSQSRSMSVTPTPSRPASPPRPLSTMPKASPIVMGPPSHALTEPLTQADRALSEPLTDISVGPPENSFEKAMLLTETSPLQTVSHSIHAPTPIVASPSPVTAPKAADEPPSLLSQIASLIDAKLDPVSRSLEVVNRRLDDLEEPRRYDRELAPHPYSPSNVAQAWRKPEVTMETFKDYDQFSTEAIETRNTEACLQQLVEAHESHAASWAMYLRIESLPADTPCPASIEDSSLPHATAFSRFITVNEKVAAREEAKRDGLTPSFFVSDTYLDIVHLDWLSWGLSATENVDLDPLPPSSLPLTSKHPKATTLGCGLDLASPPSLPPPASSHPAALAPTRASVPRRAPSPNAWFTVKNGKATTFAKVAAQAAARPAPVTPSPPSNGPLTKAQAAALTKAQLISIIKDKYQGQVNQRSNKGALVTFLLSLQARANPINLVSSQSTTAPPRSTPSSTPAQPTQAASRPHACPANQAALFNTEFTVQVGAESIAAHRPKEKAELIVRSLRTAMNQQHGGGPALVTLLSGRWSSQLNHNFVLVFAGHPTNDQVYKYRAVLTAPFGPGAHLVPQKGYTRMILHSVPLIRSQSGAPVSASGLIAEIKQNPVCTDILFVNAPTWVIRNNSPDKTHASITFAMIDEDGSITSRLIKHPPSLFGATTTACKCTTLPAIDCPMRPLPYAWPLCELLQCQAGRSYLPALR